MRKILYSFFAATITLSLLFILPSGVSADNTPNLTQQITTGSLIVDIVDGGFTPVANPTFALSSVAFSVTCKESTGVIGTVSQKMYVENPDQADDGWVVSIAATAGPTGFWNNLGAGPDYDFNDDTGCTDGTDSDSLEGQMTIDPSAGLLANGQCGSCTTTGVSLGSSAAFEEGVVDSITLLSASAGSDDVADYVVTGIDVSQLIPGGQSVDSYEIDMTITVIAI